MNTLTQWNPFREMEELQSRLGTWLGRARTPGNGDKDTLGLSDWTPLVDVSEDDKEYLIKAELPEVKKEDVRVSVDNGMLTLSGERKMEKEEKGKKFHRVERSYGSFTRSFTLPDGADPQQVKAEFKEGILLVHLPKSESAKRKSISVQVN
jgi:HSP20 family protein